jgi:hypothetical protein
VSEIFREGLYAFAGVQEDGCIEVRERVLAVLAGGGVLAALGLEDDIGLGERGPPMVLV